MNICLLLTLCLAVGDVVQVLQTFAEREESGKYLTIMLGRTGFGSQFQVRKRVRAKGGKGGDCVHIVMTRKMLLRRETGIQPFGTLAGTPAAPPQIIE